MVGTGSVVKEVDDDGVAKRRFLDEQAVRGSRHDRELAVGQAPVELDGVLESDFVIVAGHHQGPVSDPIELAGCERRSLYVHPVPAWPTTFRVMPGPVGG